MKAEHYIELRVRVDQEMINESERLKALFNSPNLITAIANAVNITHTLCNYQLHGYKIKLVRNGETRQIRLPIHLT